ncbi:DUF397 domain-containing protein [Spiractinospora alimapuensis]|uniref:DUF397 domain-containing protein n=1 Tax=Spiractinospora alimapuensis TaxID=2820884 RepID=UPI001F369EF3|nr:DUF397 domain-containing protein [Spiractinospora alimapuensis]QVQ53172.1 DUF397 domain-containing protein [Spiractinospora alimapuensis]
MSTQFTWESSSASSNRRGDCVEVGWRTSSYSVDTNGRCVEVGRGVTEAPGIAVRDTKNRAQGYLLFPHAEWAAFVRAARRDEL